MRSTCFLGVQVAVEGVMNGPLKFLTARKILPLLNLLAKFKECSLTRAPKIFAAARMLAFLSVLLESCGSYLD